jgi:DNA-binding XRE family transcriptional regulator
MTDTRPRLAETTLDAVAAKRVLDDPATDWIPEEAALRLFAGEHPVKVWREHRGLTQARLAAASGVPQPTIAHLEAGRRKGTVAQLRALAGALGIGLDTLAAFVEG